MFQWRLELHTTEEKRLLNGRAKLTSNVHLSLLAVFGLGLMCGYSAHILFVSFLTSENVPFR
jgi:hypothetical protein